RCLRREFAQKPEPFALQSDQKHVHPGYIASRSVEARHQTGLYRIKAGDKDDWNGRGRGLGCKCGWRCKRGDHRRVAPDQIGSHGRKPVELAFRPTIFDRDVAAVLITLFAQSPPKRCHHRHECIARSTIEKPDHRHRWLLRACRERPRGCAAEERDEVTSFHSITSSARSKVAVGTSRPSALAALRLRMNWNFDARSIGRSAGLAPLRIRSTKEAARRKVATKSTPYPIVPPARATSSGPIVRSRPLAASATMAPTLPTDNGSSPVSTASTLACSMLSKALTNSLDVRSRNGSSLTLSDCAVVSIAWSSGPIAGLSALRMTATQVRRGITSLSSSIRFALSSGLKKLCPVMFPPGRTSLVTMPTATGSPIEAMTMGIVVVAPLAARLPGVPWVTIRSTWERTSSAANPGSRS